MAADRQPVLKDMDTTQNPPNTVREAADSPMTWQQARILIVDDETADIALLERILRKEGFVHVKGITDPHLVTTQVATFRPAVIVLDVKMPFLDGFQVLARLQETRRESFLPVMVTTGSAERSEEHTSELQSLMRISYAVFCLKKKN